MLVCGVGINDYPFGTAKKLPHYTKWLSMIRRCYGKNKPEIYADCTVCDEWLTFSNFKDWLDSHACIDMCLDKDILVANNKVYSPETCVLVPSQVNLFIHQKFKGNYRFNKFQVTVRNPLTRTKKSLGGFETRELALKAYKEQKLLDVDTLGQIHNLNPKIVEALKQRINEIF